MVNLIRKSEVITAYTSDISANGFFAETREPFPRGATIDITFNVEGIDGSQPVEATGVVVRSVSPDEAAASGIMPGVGVRFKRIRKNDKVFRQAVDAKLGRTELPREERRSEPRLPVGMPIKWGTRDPPKWDGRMADVSASGALCVVKGAAPADGSRVYLSFTLPHKGRIKDIKAVACVRRTKTVDNITTMGLEMEFSSVGDDLLPLLKERLPKPEEQASSLMSMNVGDAARAIKDNIPRIKIGDKYHVFRWKWVLGWFSVALVFYIFLYFVIGAGTFN